MKMLKMFLKWSCVQVPLAIRVECKSYLDYFIFKYKWNFWKCEVIFAIKNLINLGSAYESLLFRWKQLSSQISLQCFKNLLEKNSWNDQCFGGTSRKKLQKHEICFACNETGYSWANLVVNRSYWMIALIHMERVGW